LDEVLQSDCRTRKITKTEKKSGGAAPQWLVNCVFEADACDDVRSGIGFHMHVGVCPGWCVSLSRRGKAGMNANLIPALRTPEEIAIMLTVDMWSRLKTKAKPPYSPTGCGALLINPGVLLVNADTDGDCIGDGACPLEGDQGNAVDSDGYPL
jgi:hypothetical protein